MNRIYIGEFGPVGSATIDLDKDLQVLMGAQASGKSTICKVAYFCMKIRDYTLDFLMDSAQFTESYRSEIFVNYLKFLTKQFMGCFGKTMHMKQFKIIYEFGEKQLSISLNEDKYVRFTFDENLKEGIILLIDNAADMYQNGLGNDHFGSIIDNVTAIALMKNQLRNALNTLFENSSEIIYIPAGRSLLATLSEQLQEFSISDMDLTMQEFIKLIRNTKSKFGSRIPAIVKDYTKTVKGQINNSAVEQAYGLIKNILKADYASESDGEKIYFDEKHWVKLMYGSSGQQEALWILMLCFITILENKNTFMVIEEPEAHLFPIAQKDIVSLIALMVNITGSKVIVTTHSPYILTSMNILLYSDKVEGNRKHKETSVIQRNLRLSYSSFAAFRIRNIKENSDSLESLMDEESHMIRTDYIDEVSNITNLELEQLIDMEMDESLCHPWLRS